VREPRVPSSEVRCTIAMIAVAAMVCACSAPKHEQTGGRQPELAPASGALLGKCRRTANAVGYPVPCPSRVPAGLFATPSVGGCRLGIIGPGGIGACSHAWRGWVVGSSETNDQHLVLVASPHPLQDPAKVVNGPAWYHGARVRPLGSVEMKGAQLQAVYVPPGTNDGSAFAHHVVLIWTAGGHTYAVGFHDVAGIRETLALDVALARGIRLVAPG
jgi:hypothetical protein